MGARIVTMALATNSAQPTDLTAIERVIVAGDLSKLTPEERWNYYKGVCQLVGLNPFTQPFLYITLSGKLVLYATKGAADQLRDNHRISISQPKIDLSDGLCIVTVTATDRTGRTDSDLGIVPCENLRGDAKANAILKAVTEAKRRVTLSMCGLGMLDETEVDTIPGAVAVPQQEIMAVPAFDQTQPATPAEPPADQAPAFDREAAFYEYRRLVPVALFRGHPKANAIRKVDPDTLKDGVLRASVAKLREFAATQPAPPFNLWPAADLDPNEELPSQDQCSATADNGQRCPLVVNADDELVYQGQPCDGAALIEQSAAAFCRVLCLDHYSAYKAWSISEGQGS